MGFMSNEKGLEKLRGDAAKVVEDARDAVGETLHRSAAEAERSRRETEGDKMTTSEKVVSGVSELKHRTQAEIDAAKRASR